MAKSTSRVIRDQWDRVKKVLEKWINPGQRQPQWVLQPIPVKKKEV